MNHCISTQTPEVSQTNFTLLFFSLLPRGSQTFHHFSWRTPSMPFFWKKFEPRNFELTAAQSWMEKGRHCLYLMWATDFVNSLALGTFWLHRNYMSYLSCTVLASDPVPEVGKTVQTSQPWSLGPVSEALWCHSGSKATRYCFQNVTYFSCCAEKSSQYCVHFLFWNLFIEDNFLLGFFY